VHERLTELMVFIFFAKKGRVPLSS